MGIPNAILANTVAGTRRGIPNLGWGRTKTKPEKPETRINLIKEKGMDK